MKISPVYYNQVIYAPRLSNEKKSFNKSTENYHPETSFTGGNDKFLLVLNKLKSSLYKVAKIDSTPLQLVDINFLNKDKNIKNSYHIYQMTIPGGSKGIKSSPNDLISSNHFYQCAGIGIVDTKNKEQFLGHIFHKTYIEDISQQLLEVFDKKLFQTEGRLNIYILPGESKLTKHTVKHILNALEMINPDLVDKVKFVHFPNKEYNFMGMYNGKVFATNGLRTNIEINPDNMCYFKNPDGVDMNFKEWVRYHEDDTLSEFQKMRIYKDYKKEIK